MFAGVAGFACVCACVCVCVCVCVCIYSLAVRESEERPLVVLPYAPFYLLRTLLTYMLSYHELKTLRLKGACSSDYRRQALLLCCALPCVPLPGGYALLTYLPATYALLTYILVVLLCLF